SEVAEPLEKRSGRPFSLAKTLSGSSGRPALSGAQHTATTFSLRSNSLSRTALPKASCPCTTIRIAGFLTRIYRLRESPDQRRAPVGLAWRRAARLQGSAHSAATFLIAAVAPTSASVRISSGE